MARQFLRAVSAMLLLQLVDVAVATSVAVAFAAASVLNADCQALLLLFLCGCVARLDFRLSLCLFTRPVNIYRWLQGSAEHTGHTPPLAATPSCLKTSTCCNILFAPVSARKGEIERERGQRSSGQHPNMYTNFYCHLN